MESSGTFTAPETYNHDLGLGTTTRTLDDAGNNETRPSFSDNRDLNIEKSSPGGGQNVILNEFDELQRQANGTTDADSAVIKDNNGTAYITAEHDTGFLNVDDDDLEVFKIQGGWEIPSDKRLTRKLDMEIMLSGWTTC